MFELYVVINDCRQRFMTGRYGYGSCVQGYRWPPPRSFGVGAPVMNEVIRGTITLLLIMFCNLFYCAFYLLFCLLHVPLQGGHAGAKRSSDTSRHVRPKGARKRPASVFVDVGKFFSAFIALHLALEVHDRNRSTTCDLWLKTLKDLKKFCRAARKGDDACCKVGIHPETSCKQLWTHAWKYHQPNWAIQELDGVRGSCQSMLDALFSCGIPWNKCRRLAQCECLHRPLNPQDDQWMGKCVF